jgi:hypothetical protein
MLTGFVAVEQGQGGRGSQGIEGDGHAVRVGAVRVEGDLFIEQGGFDGPGAALAPVRCAHFLDHAELDFVGGPEVVHMLLQENQEVLARFMVQNNTFSAHAVPESV